MYIIIMNNSEKRPNITVLIHTHPYTHTHARTHAHTHAYTHTHTNKHTLITYIQT